MWLPQFKILSISCWRTHHLFAHRLRSHILCSYSTRLRDSISRDKSSKSLPFSQRNKIKLFGIFLLDEHFSGTTGIFGDLVERNCLSHLGQAVSDHATEFCDSTQPWTWYLAAYLSFRIEFWLAIWLTVLFRSQSRLHLYDLLWIHKSNTLVPILWLFLIGHVHISDRFRY